MDLTGPRVLMPTINLNNLASKSMLLSMPFPTSLSGPTLVSPHV